MTFSDDILMAYADGELSEPERSLVEQAERDDPAVAGAIARHRALRADVFSAFAGVLEESVPARLQASAAGAGADAANVRSLDAARERKTREQVASRPDGLRARAWGQWGALAASLVVGVLAGGAWVGGLDGNERAFAALDANGRLLAQGALSSALSQQLASTAQADGNVRIGVSFAARDGSYCRSFTVSGNAGLACREGDGWRIPVLHQVPAESTTYRQAASAMPAAVLDAIDERIDGVAFDAAAERAARDRHWKR